MPTCPACGTENPGDTVACQRCGLAVGLFGAVRAAAGVPENDPQFSQEIQQILAALDTREETQAAPAAAELKLAARFPAPPPPRAESALPTVPITSPALPGIPALPPGSGVAVWRRQIEEYLQTARRQSLDIQSFSDRIHAASLSADPEMLERLSRELFVYVAAALSEAVDLLRSRIDEVSRLTGTPPPEAELKDLLRSFDQGDLVAAQRRSRQLDERVTEVEDEWATVQILLAECDLIAETTRELGGDPGPAVGPLEEGRRLAARGERPQAETVLARAALALWTVASPLVTRELGRIKESLIQRRTRGEDVAEAAHHLRELAAMLKARNFGGAIGAYRRLRTFVGSDAAHNIAQPAAASVSQAGAGTSPN